MSLASLRKLYPVPKYIHFEQVRSGTGATFATGDVDQDEEVTVADLIVLHTHKSRGWRTGLDLRYFEYKDSADDLGAEIRAGAHKSKLSRFCTETWLAVSSVKKVIPDLAKLPAGWGCVDVGGPKPRVVREPEKRDPLMPSADFLRALFRSATAEDVEALAAGAPMVEIDRPDLSRSRVGLACTHTTQKPLDKVMPKRMPCFRCLAGDPKEPEVVEAMIEDASDAILLGYQKTIERQLARRGL